MSKDITPNHYDVIVLGVGSMGSAACWHLARRGQKVLGLEQFDIPHERGSHAGQSRIIRKAYFEHPDYVPLLERAYENWQSFEKETGTRIYHRTGILYFGERENATIRGIRTSARLHGIPVEDWTHAQYQKKYPAFRVPDNFDVIYEADAGFVTPERAIRLYAGEAVRNGAVIMKNTAVKEWKAGSKIEVVTASGEYTCGKLVITAGAWTGRLVAGLKAKLQVTRQLLAWVAPPDPDRFSPDNFPCWFVEDPALGTFYGFPVMPSNDFNGPIGLKLAHHHPGIPCGPDDILGDIPAAEEEKLRAFLRTYLPEAGDTIIALKHCLYTYSPDTHFIIDHLPDYDGRVVIACGFSGHGFKFASVVGEILADLAMKGKTDLPNGFLRLER
ncbi:MAG TPA: N-methyl-L-tryptophan oxidase [Chryseosolibacter sp.]